MATKNLPDAARVSRTKQLGAAIDRLYDADAVIELTKEKLDGVRLDGCNVDGGRPLEMAMRAIAEAREELEDVLRNLERADRVAELAEGLDRTEQITVDPRDGELFRWTPRAGDEVRWDCVPAGELPPAMLKSFRRLVARRRIAKAG